MHDPGRVNGRQRRGRSDREAFQLAAPQRTARIDPLLQRRPVDELAHHVRHPPIDHRGQHPGGAEGRDTAHRVELADQPLPHRRVEPRLEHLHRDRFPAGRPAKEHHPLPALAEPPPQCELTQYARVVGVQRGDHGTEP
ncbi:hypothetical protein GCM10027612_26710 [Microbispora bryophytorum subsp. camponoti]